MKLMSFIRRWNELVTIPIGLFLFYISPYILRWIDPTAGTYDAGIFQINLYAIISLFIYQAVVWLILGLIWKCIREYYETGFTTDLTALTPWQRIKAALFVYFCLLLFLVLLSRAL